MQRSRLVLGLALSLLMHLLLLAAPAALFSKLLPPWESPPAPAEIEATLRPMPRPQLAPSHAPRKRAPRHDLPRPTASPMPSAPLPEPLLEPPPTPPEAMVPVPATPQPTPAVAPDAQGPVASPAPPATPPGMELPRNGRIQFSVSRGDHGFVVGRAVHRWRHDGAHYEIDNLTETTGLAWIFRPVTMVQASRGEVSGSNLQPREYRSERDGKLVDAASFDWAGGRLSFAGDRSAPLVAGAQDMLSAFYQLGRQAVEGGVEMALTTGKKFETYRFVVLGEEKLTLRFGEVRTIHLKSGGEPGKDATEVWLAPTLHGLPLKIRYIDRNGDAFEQTAEEIDFGDQPATMPEKP